MTRRLLAESVAIAALTGALALVAAGHPAPGEVCGEGTLFAAHLLDSPYGSPTHFLAALLTPATGPGVAWALTLALAAGLGAASLWAATRAPSPPPEDGGRGGGGVLTAALAVLIGTAPPLLLTQLTSGSPDLLAVPWVVLALTLLPRPEARSKAVGFAAVLVAGTCDAHLGAATGLAAAVAGGGGWALLAALLAASTRVVGATGALDPVDIAAPFASLRPEAVGPGLAALATAWWGARDPALRRASWVAFALALGPVLQAFGEPLTVGGAGVPLPGLLVTLFAPEGGARGALIVGAVAAALSLRGARTSGPLAGAIAALALAEAAAQFVTSVPDSSVGDIPAIADAPQCFSLDVPVGVAALAEREGAVLDLPLEVSGEGAPRGSNGLFHFYASTHHRPLVAPPTPLGETDPLYGEPAVVLVLDAALGTDRYLLPPARPGETLRGLGVTEIVLHRALLSPQALALLDPVLFRLYGAPQRDHAGGVDLYRVDLDGPAKAATPERLHASDAPAPAGWTSLPDYLASGSTEGASPPREKPANPPLENGPRRKRPSDR